MSEFICKKPITLSGRSFTYGEVIPDGYVLPGRALALVRSNYITEFAGAGILAGELAEAMTPIHPFQTDNSTPLITIPISTEKGILEVTAASQTIMTVFEIMQKKLDEAEKDIAELKDEDALILLNAADSRKGIQKASEERAIQLRGLKLLEGNVESDAVKMEDQKKDGA